MSDDLRICDVGGAPGLLFPLIPGENAWPAGLRVVLYSLALVYFFMGVAIIADIFMDSIGMVTSRWVQTLDENKKLRTSKWWNETVATLTLMALGSSAPEIFLSVIDIIKQQFHFGQLGPSTIVGSAAFNLLVIVAVCIQVIPRGEARIIENRPAFYITATFSLLAYMWMAFILVYSSPDIVDIWEGVCTAMGLPVLVYISYKVDRGDANWVMSRLGLMKPSVDADELGDEDTAIVIFTEDAVTVEPSDEVKSIELTVALRGDTQEAEVTLAYSSSPMSAVPGYDYESVSGEIQFQPGESSKSLCITCNPRATWRNSCQFLVVMEHVSGPIKFDPASDGGEDSAISVVTLKPAAPSMVSGRDAVLRSIDRVVSLNGLRRGFADWADQARNVLYVSGSAEEQASASPADWAMHLVALPWKVIFLVIPPSTFLGGWLSFYGSLGGIAMLTACVSDFAELFGCVLHVPDIVTAVTFVALGTSMPDLFASMTAAKEDPTADASIVNVTGSNSVNVFLGLGVPWTIASIYWNVYGRTEEWERRYSEIAARIDGAVFVVESRSLGFSVLSFIVVCCVALLLLDLRRRWLGGELGGPFWPKVNAFLSFIGLWGGWVVLVSWRVIVYNGGGGREFETMILQGCAVVLLLVCLGVSMLQMKLYHRRHVTEVTVVAANAQHLAQVAMTRQATLNFKDSIRSGNSGNTEFIRTLSAENGAGHRTSTTKSPLQISEQISEEDDGIQVVPNLKDAGFDNFFEVAV